MQMEGINMHIRRLLSWSDALDGVKSIAKIAIEAGSIEEWISQVVA